MAWKVFWLQSFEYQIKPFHYYAKLIPSAGLCDNERRKENCPNDAKVVLSKTMARFEVREEDFYHLYHQCASKYEGQKEKGILRIFLN